MISLFIVVQWIVVGLGSQCLILQLKINWFLLCTSQNKFYKFCEKFFHCQNTKTKREKFESCYTCILLYTHFSQFTHLIFTCISLFPFVQFLVIGIQNVKRIQKIHETVINYEKHEREMIFIVGIRKEVIIWHILQTSSIS